MKNIFTILAIAFVSLNFVSCRQDDVISEMDAAPQEKVTYKKITDTVTTDSIQVSGSQALVDPEKDPPKDRTRW